MNKNKMYTAIDFQRYYSGLMPESEMHELERSALEDPFLADALDGYVHASSAEKDIIGLKEKIAEREKKKKLIYVLFNNHKIWLKVAAVFIMMSGAAYFTWQLNQRNKEKTLAKIEKTEKTDSAPLNERLDKTPEIVNEPIAQAPAQLPADKDPGKSNDLAQQNAPVIKNDERELQLNKQDDNIKAEGTAREDSQKDIVTENDNFVAIEKKAAMAKDQKEKLPNANKYLFEGKVIDDKGNPVAYANITDIKRKNGVTSDASGKFSMVLADSSMTATIAAIGYETRQSKLKNETEQTIVLSPGKQELSEVVVTGMAKKRDKKAPGYSTQIAESTISQPVIGKKLYDQYLADSIRIPLELKENAVKGDVVLSFKLNRSGEPKKIKVIQSLCKLCDEEAIRLLRNGPKWIYVNDQRTTLSIHF